MLSLLLTSAAIAKENVLTAGKDELIWSLNEKSDVLDTSTEIKEAPAAAIEAMSWQAAEVLTEVVQEFGSISRKIYIYIYTKMHYLYNLCVTTLNKYGTMYLSTSGRLHVCVDVGPIRGLLSHVVFIYS